MKINNFKKKLIAISIMLVAFVFGINAQSCGTGFQNSDIRNLNCTLKNDTLHFTNVSPGGNGSRQSTQDSIKQALYYHTSTSAANLLQSINVNSNSLPIIAANTNTITVAATFTTITTAGTNTVASGARLVSVYNSSSTNSATLQGNTLPPLTGITFQYPNAILPNITYDCLTATLLIQILR